VTVCGINREAMRCFGDGTDRPRRFFLPNKRSGFRSAAACSGLGCLCTAGSRCKYAELQRLGR